MSRFPLRTLAVAALAVLPFMAVAALPAGAAPQPAPVRAEMPANPALTAVHDRHDRDRRDDRRFHDDRRGPAWGKSRVAPLPRYSSYRPGIVTCRPGLWRTGRGHVERGVACLYRDGSWRLRD